ncbi:hypothetical protein RDI58_021242 [Solanum bulbocastanum]|uniref:Uncharacterized protein n=1 Tax=Solanum bulbocastanum TaxID=147425 RepID=A0AAN8Y8D7_SOLBU
MNSPTAVFMKNVVKKEGDDENFQAQKKLKIGDDEISDRRIIAQITQTGRWISLFATRSRRARDLISKIFLDGVG